MKVKVVYICNLPRPNEGKGLNEMLLLYVLYSGRFLSIFVQGRVPKNLPERLAQTPRNPQGRRRMTI
jgi:hypothetical protein